MTTRGVLAAIAITIFTMQTTALIYYASQAADSSPIIGGLDGDAANAINVAGRSYPIIDNGFASYGPVYFRVANMLSWVLPDLSAPGNLGAKEARTKTWHFALVLTSVLAFQALNLGLALLLTSQLFLVFLIAAAFARVALELHPWQEMLLRAHPDHILALLTALATYLTIQYWRSPADDRTFRRSAWGWGLACATKLSLVLYMPFIFAAVLWFSKGTRFKKAAIYLGHMLAAYFLIGFIQNFNIPRTLRFLTYQAKFSLPATADSISEWLQIYFSQAIFILGLTILLVIVSWVVNKSVPKVSKPLVVFALGLGLGPLVLMILQKVTAPHDHYTIPILATQAVLLLTLAAKKIEISRSSLQWSIGLAGLALFMVFKTTPPSMAGVLQSQLKCRAEAREVYKRITDLHEQNLLIYVDPYVPTMDRTSGIVSTWVTNKEFIMKQDFKVLVLHMARAMAYIQPAAEGIEFYKNYNPEYLKSKEFYSLFYNKDVVSDPDLGTWKRTYRNDCSWEIWER